MPKTNCEKLKELIERIERKDDYCFREYIISRNPLDTTAHCARLQIEMKALYNGCSLETEEARDKRREQKFQAKNSWRSVLNQSDESHKHDGGIGM